MRDFEGELITQRIQWDEIKQDPADWGIRCFESEHKDGFCTDKGKIHTGHNSGYAACNVAYHLGYRRIIMLGFDMSMDGEKRHFFGDHPDKLNQASNYAQMVAAFGTVKPEDYQMEIWNCSRRTAMHHFPIINLEKALDCIEPRVRAIAA